MSESDPDGRPARGVPNRSLDRAPGERYGSREVEGQRPGRPHEQAGRGRRDVRPAPGAGRALLTASVVALGGAGLLFTLGLVAIGVGTVAAAAAVGWSVALALLWGGGMAAWGRPARMVIAGGFAAGAVVLGLLVGWAWARTEGGVLPPLEYVDQRYGLVAWLDVVVAAALGAGRAGRVTRASAARHPGGG